MIGGALGSLVYLAGEGLVPLVARADAPAWVKPLDGPITYTQDWEGNGNYPYEPDGLHRALDMQRVGYTDSPVYSMAAGEVIRSEWIDYLGFCAVIAHAGDYYTLYAHLESTPVVGVGDQVVAGQVLGTMGQTGGSWPVHLHLEMYQGGFSRHVPSPGGNRIDPEQIVRAAPYPDSIPQPIGEEMPSYIEQDYGTTQNFPTSDWTWVRPDPDTLSVEKGTSLVSVSAHFVIEGLGAGQIAKFRFVKYNTDTANVLSLGTIEVIGTSGSTSGQVSTVASLGSTNHRLRLQMLSEVSGVTLTDVSVKGLSWPIP
ncbi:M23 family metallopeptidase [Microbacterium sp. PA5]|uniref:M23 family metallopeptidase n=1 Tax=Microbacterium sp. PA5 TaxID=3416654 RepID=UPI003CEE6BC9